MTPHRAIDKQKKLVYTDHRPLFLVFENLPMNNKKSIPSIKNTVWNTNKPGGWDIYKELTDSNDDLEKLVEEDISEPSKFNHKFEKIVNKIKFKSFGKVTFTNRCKSDKSLESLYDEKRKVISDPDNDVKIALVETKISAVLIEKQRNEYEKKLKDLNQLKETKGRSAASFNLKAKILGEKKESQEAVVVENPETGEIVFEAEQIKTISLDYLKNLLTNREPKPEYVNDLKVIKLLHSARMNQIVEESDDVFTKKDFDDLLKNLQKNNKTKYKFILKAGSSLHKCLFRLFSLTWDSETKPSVWENTIAHQLYKGKGEKSQLSNHRFIHTKDEVPKSFEHILITKAKPKIVAGCTKFQIGAIPKHQSQEHLFTLKSVMELYESLKIALILQLFDLGKFFDKENL